MRWLFMLLMPLSLYCIYGFAGTYDVVEDQSTWRAVYCGAFLACIAAMSFVMGAREEPI